MSEFLRQPTHRYSDPLARIWLSAAARVGFRVRRSSELYASSDGRGTLWIATDELFDVDDNLAQMILHELCHALVEGEQGEGRPDWGLDNTRMGHPWREQAALRLQAWLAERFGLREFFAPTTDFRISFWQELPVNPFAAADAVGGRRERSCVAGRLGAWRSSLSRWRPLHEALEATARVAAALAPWQEDGKPAGADFGTLPSLWRVVTPPPDAHPAGHAHVAGYFAGIGCRDCAWSFTYRGGMRCRHAPRQPLPDTAPACTRFEPATTLDCLSCGACCREAYQAVELSQRDPVNRSHPGLVSREGSRRRLKRRGDRCIALEGGRDEWEAYACTIYADRPRTCREFERAGEHCLDARRRVGLSL